ncbi:hypothetical protein LSTR_LSTR010139 [Laodelphax striatellus]|uniref:BTB domain-containing protein n=1 Tax=Laodelphax striatellus TaxID=195883 RepID=A0A482WJ13_LAOST|nr:hypothetical protein LSTR_LSTR010139 [Laodelphax striatellus]
METTRNVAEPKNSLREALRQKDGMATMSSQAMQALYELREERLLCDAVIKLDDGQIFYVHRAIISACSSFFRTLFTTTLNGSDKTNIDLPGVSSQTMNLILEYVYLRRLTITNENVSTLLVTADFLGFLGVIHLCCQFLKKHMNPRNCIGIYKFALYEATDMNIYRSALSACVIMGLPNISDYIHKHRELLMEEKRQKLLSLENNNNQENLNNMAVAVAAIENAVFNGQIEDILEENDMDGTEN